MMKEAAQRSARLIVKGDTPEAWAATAKLRQQFVATTMDAMPARVAAARAEYAELRKKILVDRSVTVNDVAIGAARGLELYCCYLVGRAVGSKQLSPP